MSRRNRRPDWRRIKSHYSYTIDEAAKVLQVHRNAVRYWVKKCGLPVMTDQRPHLIQGRDLVAFLKKRRAVARIHCPPGQMYCLKCRRPQPPGPAMLDYEPFTVSRGSLIGICLGCDGILRRFVSRRRLPTLEVEFGLQIRERKARLVDTDQPRLDCHSVEEV